VSNEGETYVSVHENISASVFFLLNSFYVKFNTEEKVTASLIIF